MIPMLFCFRRMEAPVLAALGRGGGRRRGRGRGRAGRGRGRAGRRRGRVGRRRERVGRGRGRGREAKGLGRARHEAGTAVIVAIVAIRVIIGVVMVIRVSAVSAVSVVSAASIVHSTLLRQRMLWHPRRRPCRRLRLRPNRWPLSIRSATTLAAQVRTLARVRTLTRVRTLRSCSFKRVDSRCYSVVGASVVGASVVGWDPDGPALLASAGASAGSSDMVRRTWARRSRKS